MKLLFNAWIAALTEGGRRGVILGDSLGIDLGPVRVTALGRSTGSGVGSG
jgi:hypothetical protein